MNRILPVWFRSQPQRLLQPSRIRKLKSLPALALSLVGGIALSFAPQALAAAKPKPVEIWCNSQTDEKYYLDMISRYQKAVDKNFEANVRSYGFTEMPDKLAIAIKSGINPPDIVQLDEIYISLYLGGKVPFVDLTDRIRKAGFDRSIMSQRMGLFAWKDKIYGLPQSTSNVVLFYRDDIFKELKITPKMIDTWDKLEDVALRIKSSTRGMLALDWSYFEILLRQRGYDLFDDNGNVLPDSAVAVSTLERIQKWAKEGIGLIPDRGSIFEPEFFNSYVANNGVLAVIGADWYGLDMIKNMDPKHSGNWKAMPLPVWTDSISRGRSPTSAFSGQGLVIFKKSKQVDRSWKFIEWVNSDIDANVERFLQGNCLTPYTPAWSDMRLNQSDSYFGNQSLSGLLLELAPKSPRVRQSPHRAQVVNLFREKFWSTVSSGSTPAAQAISEIKQEVQKTSKASK